MDQQKLRAYVGRMQEISRRLEVVDELITGSDCLWQYNQCMEDNDGSPFCDDVFDSCIEVVEMMCEVE